MITSRWWAPAVLAAAFGLGAGAMPAPVHAQSIVGHVLVDIADVVVRGGVPYYRYGNYGPYDRLTVQHDHHGRATYYRSPYPAGYGYGYGQSARHAGGHSAYYDGGHSQRVTMRHDDQLYDTGGHGRPVAYADHGANQSRHRANAGHGGGHEDRDH